MKFLVLCFIFLLLCIKAEAANPVYPLKVGPNGRYLVDQTNTPFFWSGDTAWSLIVQPTKEDALVYLDNRAQKGFTVVLANLIEHKFSTKAPANIYGDLPFTGTPFSTPNETYFAHVDYIINQAAQRGIAVLLAPLYIGYGCGDEGWCAEIQASSESTLNSWGQYVGNRYKNFNNIIWVIGGDADPSVYGIQNKVTAFVNGLQQQDNRHLITAHNARQSMAISPWMTASWLTLNNIYTSLTTTTQYAQIAYTASPIKPFFQIESYYENSHSMTTQQLRAQAYWTTLSGGIGVMFGNCGIWAYGYSPAYGFCDQAVTDWKSSMSLPGSISMQHYANFFRSQPFQDFVPDITHAAVTAGYGTVGSTSYVTTATINGKQLISYIPTGQTITVAMNTFTSQINGTWFDPSNGTSTPISGSPFANTGTKQFVHTGANASGATDWVLILERDNLVDNQDFVLWLNHYLQSVQGPTNGDFDNNSIVDGRDYAIWLNTYGT